jgi:hypothetical protein
MEKHLGILSSYEPRFDAARRASISNYTCGLLSTPGFSNIVKVEICENYTQARGEVEALFVII